MTGSAIQVRVDFLFSDGFLRLAKTIRYTLARRYLFRRLVLHPGDKLGCRVRQIDQGKAQSAGNGKPFPRTATPQWRICLAPVGQGDKRPSALLHSLALAMASAVLVRLASERFSSYCIRHNQVDKLLVVYQLDRLLAFSVRVDRTSGKATTSRHLSVLSLCRNCSIWFNRYIPMTDEFSGAQRVSILSQSKAEHLGHSDAYGFRVSTQLYGKGGV